MTTGHTPRKEWLRRAAPMREYADELKDAGNPRWKEFIEAADSAEEYAAQLSKMVDRAAAARRNNIAARKHR